MTTILDRVIRLYRISLNHVCKSFARTSHPLAISSVHFSRSVVSDSLRPHEPQHTRPPCPSPTPGVHPNPCPLSRWCHPTISSFVVPFSSCPQSFPATGSFPMSQLFPSSCQSIWASASASVLPTNHSVQSLSHVWLFVTPWTAACQTSLSITNSRNLLKLTSTESVMPSNHFILCCPLLLLLSIFPSIRVFSNESVLCIRWPKYWSFSFSISSSNEYLGLISFRIDWFDLLEVQGTLKSLPQHHNSKASILWCSAFFMVQTHICMWKNIALTRWTFVGKVSIFL